MLWRWSGAVGEGGVDVDGGRIRRSPYGRRALCVAAVAMIAVGGCAPATPDPVPVDEARARYEEMLPQLQDAVLQGAEASWTQDAERLRLDDEDVCRWSPGDSTAQIVLPEDDPEAWEARRVALDPVLTEYGFDEAGDATRRSGAPAFGFFSDRADGAGVHIFTAAGTTVVRVSGIPVEASACR